MKALAIAAVVRMALRAALALAVLLVVLFLASSAARGESVQWTGWWNGQYGTWWFEAPVCNRPGCQMCDEIRALLAAQSRSNAMRYRQLSVAGSAQGVRQAQSQGLAAANSQAQVPAGYRMEAYTAYETRFRQVLRCFGGVCRWVTESYQQPVTRYRYVSTDGSAQGRRPAGSARPSQSLPKLPKEILDLDAHVSLKATPEPVVEAMLAALRPEEGAKVYDLGCGDGRFLLAAAKDYGAVAVGIELDEKLVAQIRTEAERSGLADRVTVYQGDLRDFDYAEADYAVLYLYGDILEEAIARLPVGCKIASFQHEPPGIDSIKQVHRENGKDFYYFTGEKK